jgi:hypothetical protein
MRKRASVLEFGGVRIEFAKKQADAQAFKH